MLVIMNNDCSGQSIAETLPDEAWQFYDAAVTIGRDGRLRRPRVAPHLYVANVAGKGRGVFCEVSIAAHEVIEIAPVVVLSPDEIEHVRKTRLKEYYFEFWDTYCLAFGVASLFNSSQIPGEILDLTVVRNDVLARSDGAGARFAKALTGAWYEVLAQMSATGPAGDKVLTAIAEGQQDTLASYREQLSTTKMFYTPRSAIDFGASTDMKQKMALVRQFVFEHGLLGNNTKSVDDVAIKYPDGTVQGKPDRVRLTFDHSYMGLAAQGKL